MNINIKTTAKQCHITVNLRIQDHILLSLSDTDDGNIDLFPPTGMEDNI
jgi:hypothetical protein